jgi:hypothetical protein
VNPFMLLIGPAMTVGMFIVKMFVAAGFWVSNQFALLPHQHDREQAGVAVYARSQSQDRPDELIVRLDSGRVFRGPVAELEARVAHNTPGWGTLFAYGPTSPSAGSRLLAVELTDRNGGRMLCRLYDEAEGPAAGKCESESGATFDLTL